ncbi:endolytic transglycosylase MltG [Blastococcus sp. CCUG 61487]|uniref:endolytic transglycosylase MltG n=1 Tax=Blastococcus sp. CCUG 61487 TaxID=1840703 RepID=UPI001485660C|nr:endolytic transglycosylase MltG [Blastococcus sp. CCUG 61487]
MSGLLDRHEDQTGPLAESDWWAAGSHDPSDGHRPDSAHPSGPLPPLPPRPPGVWDRLRQRPDDEDATVAHPLDPHDLRREEPPVRPPEADVDPWEDSTGGLEVIGAHVDDHGPRRGRGRRRRAAGREEPGTADRHHDDGHHDESRRGGRRRRRPVAVLLSLLVLGGLVAGIVFGVQALMGLLAADDYTGEGTGSVEIRVEQGDTLTDIARTLVGADVIASTGPFVSAAEGRPEATGIQPGRYGLRQQMSGAAALDLLLSAESRLLSRVTVPEGLTVARTLERLATETGRPLEEFQAAAADLPALGLPAYANAQLEGFLYPATYDIEPEDTAGQILRSMVQKFTTVAAGLQLEQRAAALGRTPGEIVTVASLIQSETRLDEERPDVAQVIYNRLGQGIPLGIDATLAYGLSKSGNDLTVTDLRTDGDYNTRTRTGLPPTPISSPGEASLEAALSPSSGPLLYYVLESQDGKHFFTADYAEFQAARQRCAEAGLGCGG